jgi:Bacterial EndoU nuclease
LKRDRIISVKNKAKSGTSGFYTADVTYKGVTKEGKTFFPSNWRPNEVVEKIVEAYKNFDGVPKSGDNGRFIIESFTNEGVKIRIIMQENISTAKIITAYPVLDELIN